tara:strand:- start:2316 stop:4718 length:2403 start_codon:yes stop_codon:yes gene_type:complete
MSKKITIANPQVFASDALRNYFYKWNVGTDGQIEYLEKQGEKDIVIVTELRRESTPFPRTIDNIQETSLKDGILAVAPPPNSSTVAGTGPSITGGYRPLWVETEKITIKDNRGTIFPRSEREEEKENFQNLINDLLDRSSPGAPIPDFVTIATTQPIIEETLNSEFDNPSDQQGVSFHYNYFDREYEEELNKVTNHYFIPNIYETTSLDSEQEVENLFRTPIVTKLTKNLEDTQSSLKTQNQIVPPENNNEFTATSGYSSFFPMMAEVVVSSGQGSKSEIAGVFTSTAQGVNFIRDIQSVTPPTVGLDSVINETITISSDIVGPDGTTVIVADDVDNVKTSNLAIWIDRDGPGWYGSHPLPDNFSFIGPPSVSSDESEFGIGAILGVNTSTFFDRLREVASANRRTFANILTGDLAYSETLMYKIEKFIGPIDSITTSDPIQSFHFMNIGDMVDFYQGQLQEDQQRKLKFIDTQVKYGQDYSYVVTAYQAIVGTHYKYETDSLEYDLTVQPFVATMDVTLETIVKVVEIPLYATSGKVLDLPPLTPNVDFKPIQGSANQIRISLDMSLGSQDLEPISLNATEQGNFDQMAVNQNRSDGLLTFGSDNAPIAFEVYRLNSPPANYGDFDGALLSSIPTELSDGKTKRQASSATYIAGQPINEKHYYMFRSVDYHGGLSNPSTIYEVELYGDNGVTFPIIREYQFGQISPKMDSKPARKIIQIVPRFTQAYLNEEASGLVDPATGEIKSAMGSKIYLGVEDEPLFGRGDKPRKFKIRITSKTTGKKIDLNVNFKTKEVKAQTQ